MCKTTESDRLTRNAIVNISHGKKFKHGRNKCSMSGHPDRYRKKDIQKHCEKKNSY
jgi:hypothetical protein